MADTAKATADKAAGKRSARYKGHSDQDRADARPEDSEPAGDNHTATREARSVEVTHAQPLKTGLNPFLSVDPHDGKMAQQRNYTAGPAGPVAGDNPFAHHGIPVPALTADSARALHGPQS